METYRKTYTITTEVQAQALLDAQDDFYNNPVIGQAAPRLNGHLLKIWNGGEPLEWQWDNESRQEYDKRIAKETAEEAEQKKLESDNDHFLDIKIRRWRDERLVIWIDDTFIRPLKYNLTVPQVAERIQLYRELLDWPDLTDFSTYKTDTEIDDLKPAAPSWYTP